MICNLPSSAAEDFLFVKRVLIFANGEVPDIEKAASILRSDDLVIAADGGMRHALALGLTPQFLIGDLDSLPPGFDLEKFTGTVIRHPRDKNETDLELAIQYALEQHPEQVVILGALGGRLDQTLGNISLLNAGTEIRLDDGTEEVLFCREQCIVDGIPGDTVSLIPWQEEAGGIRTAGLKWPLNGETLYPQKTRGISNEMTAARAVIQVRTGLLLVVHRRRDR